MTMTFRVRVSSFEAVCRMAEQGVGIGIVPLAAARRARRSMAVKIVPLSDPWTERDLVVATRPGAEASPHAQALIDWLLKGEGAA